MRWRHDIVLNCIDRRRDTPVWDRPFLVWEGEDRSAQRSLSYREFDAEVRRLAGALRALDVQPGDLQPTREADTLWTEHVKEMYQGLLLRKAKSWFTGYNSNVEGHDKIRYLIYNGGAPRYRQKLTEVAAQGYEGFRLS
ncbi:MAG: hypothetical protein ABI702_10590 [Burkholderiales bacterium]